jgi:D-alanyl-D-alanine carboxypeptidase (penicillin-binding protein 5/6)
MFRRTIVFLIMILSLCQVVAAAPPPPQIGAEAAVVMDANTQQILFTKNPNKIMYPASTTKMVTLLTALDKGNLDSIVTISPKAASVGESCLGLNTGDKLTLRELLTGMMVVSGNDAAVAVAEHVGGSVPAFVAMMNAKAEKVGMINTHFSNPDGLPDPYNHFSTALDLARVAAYGMKNPDFARIVSLPEYTVHFLNRSPIKACTTNKFLTNYPGADGIKTGYTDAAGDCLVAGAKHGDVQLIVVLLNDDDRWEDAPKLMDYGFQLVGK